MRLKKRKAFYYPYDTIQYEDEFNCMLIICCEKYFDVLRKLRKKRKGNNYKGRLVLGETDSEKGLLEAVEIVAARSNLLVER